MIYIVFYTYIFDDNEEAPRETLGVFCDEGSAYKCAIQKYCQEIQTSWKYEEEGLKNTLEENLLGTPEEVYYTLHSWRDEVFASEYTKDGDSVGPMVFVQSMKISKTWNLDGYLKKSKLTAGGKLKTLIDDLSATKSGKLGNKGMKELLRKLEDGLSYEYAEKVVQRVGLTSSANKIWKGYLKKESDNQLNRNTNILKHPIEMVEIKAGTFKMGSPDDEENRRSNELQHEVKLTRDFLVMKYLVTQALWESVMGENPSVFKGASRPVERVGWLSCVVFANKLSDREGFEKVYDIPEDCDVTDDNFIPQVKMNLNADGYRLPTEAEWEYAAKGGEDNTYAGGNKLYEVGWFQNNSKSETHKVGEKEANANGLYDMSGNVWEWCWDGYEEYKEPKSMDPTGKDFSLERVFRGGFYHSRKDECRVACRDYYGPSRRANDYFYPSLRYVHLGVRLFRTKNG